MPGSEFEIEFSALLSDTAPEDEGAPSSLKAHLYSALVRKQQEIGPLASLQESPLHGHHQCRSERDHAHWITSKTLI